MKASLVGIAWAVVIAFGCSASTSTIVEEIAQGGYFSHVIPPINSGCGRTQPGYLPADATVDPPIPPTLAGSGAACAVEADCADSPLPEVCLDGRCRQVYDVLADPFCSVSWTYRFSTQADAHYWDWWAYVLDMGEPDPERPLPLHLQPIWPAARDSGMYCAFRWRIDSAQSLGQHSAHDIQELRMVLESVSPFCSRAYAPGGFCPERDAPPECIDPVTSAPIIDAFEGYLYRSSDPDVVLFLDTPNVELQQRDPRFQGFVLMTETSGAPRPGLEGGWTFFYHSCETPLASADGQGPGYCAPCRYGSGTNQIPRCGWEDVRALPANPTLIHPDWIGAHRGFFEEVHNGG